MGGAGTVAPLTRPQISSWRRDSQIREKYWSLWSTGNQVLGRRGVYPTWEMNGVRKCVQKLDWYIKCSATSGQHANACIWRCIDPYEICSVISKDTSKFIAHVHCGCGSLSLLHLLCTAAWHQGTFYLVLYWSAISLFWHMSLNIFFFCSFLCVTQATKQW